MAAYEINGNFNKRVLEATGAVVVDFWAPWCGYCKRLGPAVDRLADALSGKVDVVKLDIDDEPALADKYGVETIPTLMLFKDGKKASEIVNPNSQDAVEDWLKANGVL